jgi:hypothetical protein
MNGSTRPIRWFGTIMLVLATLLFSDKSAYADAENDIRHIPDQELVIEQLVLIDRNTEYDVTSVAIDPPKITLQEYGDPIDYENQAIVFHEPLKGLYDKKKNIVFLEQNWDSANVRHVEVLLMNSYIVRNTLTGIGPVGRKPHGRPINCMTPG